MQWYTAAESKFQTTNKRIEFEPYKQNNYKLNGTATKHSELNILLIVYNLLYINIVMKYYLKFI